MGGGAMKARLQPGLLKSWLHTQPFITTLPLTHRQTTQPNR